MWISENMFTQKQLGKKIRELRKSLGLSQAELGKVMGFSRVTITQIESGQRGLEALELAKIAKVFNISFEYFLKDESLYLSKERERIKDINDKNIKFNKNKLKNAILYILKQCGGKPNIGETVLYKLLYFIDFDCFEISGKPITGMRYVKLQFGPAPRAKEYIKVMNEMLSKNELQIINQEYHGMAQKRYIALTDADVSIFNGREIKVIDEVILKLSDMNASQIEDYVHKDAPWEIAEEKETIPYNLVFERTAPYAHFDYEKMWQDTSAYDVLKDLGELSQEELNYYRNLPR